MRAGFALIFCLELLFSRLSRQKKSAIMYVNLSLMEKHPLHLKNPELQTSPEVNRAVKRQDSQTGEKVPNDPTERIEVYMERLESIFLNPDERKRERNLEMFRDKIYDALIIKRENFPDSYFELQKRIARERGQAVEEIPKNVREQMMDVATEDQKASLDAWIDYLTSEDAVYPAWFKYFVWRNVTKLSQFDKERGEFKKRTDSTVAPYPDIYREPLAQIADIYEKVKADNKNLKEPEIREAFGKKFPALYAELIQKSLATQIENKEEIAGFWVKYSRGKYGDAEKLFQSIEGKGTGWCTAGRSTAQAQIESGDFYVYYTNDANDSPTQPRLAIRMEGNQKIGEIRGILPLQGVEPHMQEVLDVKLSEFGSEADAYRKKSEDMHMLTAIEEKHKKGEQLTKDNLLFLYEINTKIEGFGYGRDPRIEELRKTRDRKADARVLFEQTTLIEEKIYRNDKLSKEELIYLYELDEPAQGFSDHPKEDPRIKELQSRRNHQEDLAIILECTPEQIAKSPDEILENTKAYIGSIVATEVDPKNGEEKPLPRYKDIFKKLGKVENIYTSFPEKQIRRETIETGGETAQQIADKLKAAGFKINETSSQDWVNKMLKSKEFEESLYENPTAPADQRVLKGKSKGEFVEIALDDLGLKSSKLKDIYARAKFLGLELCPPEVGPRYLLMKKDMTTSGGSWLPRTWIGMKPKRISWSRMVGGTANRDMIFELSRNELGANGEDPDDGKSWVSLEHTMLFSLPRQTTK